jgi:hypothetical protein
VTFSHFDVAFIVNHKIYYKKNIDEFITSLSCDVYCELNCGWFICP